MWGYWNASSESLDKLLFVKREDLVVELKRLASSVGCPFSVDEDPGIKDMLVE